MKRALISLAVALGLMLAGASAAISQVETADVLIFSGTTGYRHSGAGEAIQPDVVEAIQDQLAAAGISSDYRTCDGTGTGGGALPGCRNPTEGVPAIFTSENLAQYDAIFFWQASSQFRGQPQTGPLFNTGEQAVIEEFAHNGGGIAAMHASVTMGAGDVTWPWWDAPGDSAIGALMPGHSATDINNVATVQVADRNHPSTRDLPDSYEFGDEHYTFSTNVRGTHHVLMTLDEESYDLGPAGAVMGADHPIAWCRMYEGARIWASSLGHFAASYRENGFDNNLMAHLVGGAEWVAGIAGQDSDCGGTVWSNFSRTTLATGLNAAIGLDVAPDGKVYWTEIGVQGVNSQGLLRMYDPDGGGTSTLLTLPTRAEYPSSNAGVLGMALDPDFETNRHLYVYYSPRLPAADSNCDPPQANCVADDSYLLGHNVVSRFTLNAAGTAVVAGSEQEILRVPSIKVGNNNSDGIAGKSTYSAHQGGGSLSFDSDGNLYLGTGDDVDPFMGQNHNYAPIDQRYPERYDARNTAANTNDLRGKILRIHPLPDASGEPGVGTTYSIPDGNMFPQGTAQTMPEIYAMGFRNPFTVQADPNDPGTVVVGEYGPDAGSDSATFGPAGVIEWDHIDEPGFYGWPLCVGDNAPDRSYFRYTFPSGPQGARFDCAASEIPNESEFNTGLDQIPGPAAPADVWAKNGGGTPARFGIPGTATEAATGPIYDYDPNNPSETKWPAYYDGAWLIFNRAANWWREVRPLDDRSGILRVNGFLQPNQFGTPAHNFVIPTRFGPDGSLYLITWSGGCCRSGLPGLGAGTLMRIDFTGEAVDTAPPNVNAQVTGNQQGGAYVDRATLTLTATDASGVDTIEYRVNGGEWTAYDGPVQFTEPGSYDVDYRATDLAPTPNTSEPQTVSFQVIEGSGCVPVRSDEFDGTTLDTARWSFLHPTTPSSGPGAPSVGGGSLALPLGNFSVDLTRPGPIGYLGQPLPEDDFTLTTEISAPGLDADVGGSTQSRYAQAGLKLFQTDNDWVKVAHTRNNDGNPPGSVNTYFEMTYENGGTRTLGDRVGMGPPATNLPTWWVRVVRTGDMLSAAYSLTDPEVGATWTPLTFGSGATSAVDIGPIFAPADGPVYIGPYGGNGSVTASYDYVRFDPDESDCPENNPPVVDEIAADPDSGDAPLEVAFTASASDADDDELTYAWDFGDGGTSGEQNPTHTYSDPGVYEAALTVSDGTDEVTGSVTVTVNEPAPEDETPPVTSVQLNGAPPLSAYDGPVTATLIATDEPGGSGVELTEYALDGGAFQVYNALMPPVVTVAGGHAIDYRSTDVAGNVEATKSVSFVIEAEPGEPELTLAATPKVRSAKAGRVATLTATARNLGEGPAAALRVCAKAPRKRALVRGNSCLTRPSLAAGAAFAAKFKLVPKRSARGKRVTVSFTASASGASVARATATLSVKRG